MKSQRNQLIALLLLIAFWGYNLHRTKVFEQRAPLAAKAKNEKTAAAPDSLLKVRFRRVRSEMDALYRYRLNPPPFDSHSDPFRIPGLKDGPANSSAKSDGPPPPGFAEGLLKSAVSQMQIGGVVTMRGLTKLTAAGRLFSVGDIVTVKVGDRKVLVLLKSLSSAAAVFSLQDADSGGAEVRVRLQ